MSSLLSRPVSFNSAPLAGPDLAYTNERRGTSGFGETANDIPDSRMPWSAGEPNRECRPAPMTAPQAVAKLKAAFTGCGVTIQKAYHDLAGLSQPRTQYSVFVHVGDNVLCACLRDSLQDAVDCVLQQAIKAA